MKEYKYALTSDELLKAVMDYLLKLHPELSNKTVSSDMTIRKDSVLVTFKEDI